MPPLARTDPPGIRTGRPGIRPGFLGAALSVLLLVSGCAELIPDFHAKPETVTGPDAADSMVLSPIAWNRVPGWNGANFQAALPVFYKSCDKLAARKPDDGFGGQPIMGTVADWRRICQQAKQIPAADRTKLKYFFETRLEAFIAGGDSGAEGLITGYYEPELRGSWTPSESFRYPIYSVPKDLISLRLGDFAPELGERTITGRLVGDRFLPYHDRAGIDAGALAGRQQEILWVDSAIDVFFLHVQGSGKVVMPDGSNVRVGFAGRNGWPYTAIGRELVRLRQLRREDVTLQSIRGWLQNNPLAAPQVMATNQSYIFFRVIEGAGPIGAQGLPLTPGRSVAVDRRFIPLGTMLWLDTHDPLAPARPLRRLVVAQDTGSAIKGVVRGDLFFGFGPEAGARAGRMKHPGRFYLLLPRQKAGPTG